MRDAKRILVLAVDLDNDLGRAGIPTPILGRDRVLDAAIRFALYDPEDSDANVLFAAVKLADELRGKGYDAAPAVVAGSELGGAEASMRARQELERLIEEYQPDGVVVVSDGSEDELLVPMVSSLAPVYGVHRLVIKQLRGVEETYILLAKYIKKVITEPRFSRMFLGVPGIILVAFSVLALMHMLREALLVVLMLAGAAMVVRGFDLEERIVKTLTETPVALVSYAIAGISAALGIVLAVLQFIHAETVTPGVVADTIRGATGLLGFAASIAILGHAASKFVSGSTRLGRELVSIVTVVAVVVLLDTLAEALDMMNSFSLSSLIHALMASNFAVYTIVSVLLMAIAWRAARLLERPTYRTSSPSAERREEHGTAQPRQTRARDGE
ncbi:hypothetical protein CF15_06565 [Pyrodictium occultum]|uniref:DUF373 family protein n=1 Tax=Pyrodictium occultum TaxID=2309 RepID=A0A0V8RWI4_PYROC|nr:DUF373 family protein [Pyrodictium occultum]KSW12387.1 hypothetical protein CF15_06565 [Pyrodictium occultum]